jgi:hypothetical protein
MRITMNSSTVWAVVSMGLAVVLVAGCEGGGLGGGDFSGLGYTGFKPQVMCAKGDVTTDQAMELARRVLAKEGFRLKSVDKDQLRIETQPSEQTVRGGEGRLRDTVVKVPNRVRRTATLEFSDRGDELRAFCQVKIERLETGDFRVFAQQRQFNDVPTETPIDREAATTARQNTVWSSAGRDEAMEREILADLHDRVQAVKAQKEAKQAPATEPAK